mgnify:CR=1 FL=1
MLKILVLKKYKKIVLKILVLKKYKKIVLKNFSVKNLGAIKIFSVTKVLNLC